MGALSAIRGTRALEGGADIPVCSRMSSREMNLGLLKRLSVEGFRGFSQGQSLRFARPNGGVGSGITILVGPNNGGKSTIIEALLAWSQRNATFSDGKRNRHAGDRVSIRIVREDRVHELRTVDAASSQTIREPKDPPDYCYVLPSRRFFNPFFGLGILIASAIFVHKGYPTPAVVQLITFLSVSSMHFTNSNSLVKCLSER